MAPNEHRLSLDTEEKKEPNHVAIESMIFDPPAVSTLSLADLTIGTRSLQPTSCFTRFSGIIYSLIASLLFTCATFFIKQLGVDLLDALLLRLVIQTSITFLFAIYKKYQLLPGTSTQIVLQLLCCGTGAGAFILYFFAIRYVELPDVTTLCYTRVVWTVVFSVFVYRARPATSTLIALPLTLLGVTFVTQPSFLFSSTVPAIALVNSKLRLVGLTLSIISAMISATNVLLFKQLISTSKDIKPSVLNFQYCFAVLTFLVGYQFHKSVFLHKGLSWSILLSWPYIVASLICLVMILCNILTQKAIKREHPAIFTLLGSADIIFALMLQNLFTSKRSNVFALLGSALVISSVVIIGLSKIVNERRLKKKIRLIDEQTVVQDLQEKQPL